MTTPDSAENQTISPEALMSELGIKKTKYYDILKHLDIKADKDSSGNIYLTLEKIERIIRKASELKARELATPDLAIRAIADRMTEDELPEDLKEKVEALREAVNPKWTPADLADQILATYRSNLRGN